MSTHLMEAGTPVMTTEAAPSESAPARGVAGSARGLWKSPGRLIASPAVHKLVLSLADQAAVSGTSFLTSVLIGRLCSPSELGVYYLALSIVFFVRGVQEHLISAPYMIYCNRRDGEALVSYGGSVLAHQLILSVLTVVGLSGLATALAWGYGPSGLGATAWVLLGAAPLMLFREFVRQLAFARLKLAHALAVDVGVAGLQLSALGLLAWHGWLTIPAAYAVMGGACAAACLPWIALRAEPMRIEWSRIVPDWRHNWGFARWALASQLIGATTPYLMPWFVAIAQDEAETGLLAACTTLVGLGNMFVMGVGNYLGPKAAQAFATGGAPELRSVMWRTAALFTGVLGSFCLLVFATGDLAAVLVYGEAYRGCGMILLITAIAMFLESLSVTAGNGLWAMEKPSANFAADVISLSAVMVTAVCLIEPYGAIGAALSTLAGAVAGTAVRSFTLLQLIRTVGVRNT